MWIYRDTDGDGERRGRVRTWVWFVIGALVALLTGCGTTLVPTGTTHATFSKTAAGDESLSIADGKDRGAFEANVTKPDGTQFHVSSTDSNGSTAQANAMAATAATLDKLVGLIQSGALVTARTVVHAP